MTAYDEGVDDVSESSPFPEIDEPPPLILQNYEMGRILGQGRASTVTEAKCKKTGGFYAIKAVASETNPSRDTEVVLAQEALILKKVNHPNCVSLHKAIYSAKRTYLFLSRVSGTTVLERIQATKGISEVDTVQTIICICKALQHLHGQGIVHRSVGPRNVVYTSSSTSPSDYNNVVLCGFHNAYFTAAGPPSTLNVADRRYGRIDSIPDVSEGDGETRSLKVSPEMAAGGPGGVEGDLYALGKLLYHMLAGDLLGKEAEPVGEQAGSTIVFDEGSWSHLSPSSKELISSLLSRDPSLRPSLPKVLEHRWVKSDASSSVNRLPPSHRALILLRQIATLQGLESKCLQDIAERLELVSAPAGQFLFRSGDVAEFLFFVCSGSVQLISNNEPYETISERGYFGHRPVLDAGPHTTDAKSLGAKPTQDAAGLFRLSKAQLDELVTTHAALRTALLNPSPSGVGTLPSSTSRTASGSGSRLLGSSKRNMGTGRTSSGDDRPTSGESRVDADDAPGPSRTCCLS